MVDSYTATSVVIIFLVVFCVLIPILERLQKIREFISLRWMLVVVYSAMCLGVLIDFSHLDNSVRFAVVIGGIVLSAIFLLVRSIEKAMFNNWSMPRFRSKLSKGDVQAELSFNTKLEQSLSSENRNRSDDKYNDEMLPIDDELINGVLEDRKIHRKVTKEIKND